MGAILEPYELQRCQVFNLEKNRNSIHYQGRKYLFADETISNHTLPCFVVRR
jgi:hypothetical protein